MSPAAPATERVDGRAGDDDTSRQAIYRQDPLRTTAWVVLLQSRA
jgi:hypothetical protein